VKVTGILEAVTTGGEKLTIELGPEGDDSVDLIVVEEATHKGIHPAQ